MQRQFTVGSGVLLPTRYVVYTVLQGLGRTVVRMHDRVDTHICQGAAKQDHMYMIQYSDTSIDVSYPHI